MFKKKQIPISRLIFLAATALILIAIGFMIVTSREPVQKNGWVIATNVLNILFFLVQLLRAIYYHPFSLDMMFWVFHLFFFGYAPLLQHLVARYNWGADPTYAEVVGTNLIILLWSVLYVLIRDRAVIAKTSLGIYVKTKCAPIKESWMNFYQKTPLYKATSSHKCSNGKAHLLKKLQKYQRGNMKSIFMNTLMVVAILFAGLDLLVNGFAAQLTRASSEASLGGSSFDLIFTHGVNNTLLFITSLHIFDSFKNRKLNIQTIVVSLCFLIACFPTGLSRNMMAAFYAGLLIVLFKQTKKGRWFSWAVIGGLALAYPLLEIFRYAATLSSGNFWSTLTYIFRSTYLVGHYDAFSMLTTIFDYVREFGITWGGQLLGALLFFVPRAIWPGKPSGSGHTAINALGQYDFSNVSAPLLAEGYINFGFLGIILFAIALGVIVQKLDRSYWSATDQDFRLIDFLYPHLIFMFFFMLRGDLLSSGAYVIAQCVIGTILFKLYRLSIHLSKDS